MGGGTSSRTRRCSGSSRDSLWVLAGTYRSLARHLVADPHDLDASRAGDRTLGNQIANSPAAHVFGTRDQRPVTVERSGKFSVNFEYKDDYQEGDIMKRG